MTFCEDAPCCGCCTPRALGWHDEPDYDSYYDNYDDRDDDLDPADCAHDQGDYDDINVLKGTVECAYCGTSGVSFSIMGQDVYRFPVTKDTSVYEGGEDRHLDGSYEA